MNMAPQKLEKSASQYATDAIKYDSQGARGMAITTLSKGVRIIAQINAPLSG